MKFLLVHCLMMLLLNISYIYAMEHGGYKIIESVNIPRAVTLATNDTTIAVGTVLGPVKLYDIQGKHKGKIPYCGDGGLVFTGKDVLVGVSCKGEAYEHLLGSAVVDKLCDIGATTYSIAHSNIRNRLFFGLDMNAVCVWDLNNKWKSKTYSDDDKLTDKINCLQVTDKAIITASSHGCFTSIDRESGCRIWKIQSHYDPFHGLTKNNSVYYAGHKNGELVRADQTRLYDRVALNTSIYSLACLKSGYLAVGSNGDIKIYDIRKIVVPLMKLMLPKKESIVTGLEATENGFVAIIDHDTFQVWQD